jgi:hypothetical protein
MEQEIRGSGDVTTVDVQSLLEAFLNMSVRCGCFIDKALFWQKLTLLVLQLIS